MFHRAEKQLTGRRHALAWFYDDAVRRSRSKEDPEILHLVREDFASARSELQIGGYGAPTSEELDDYAYNLEWDLGSEESNPVRATMDLENAAGAIEDSERKVGLRTDE